MTDLECRDRLVWFAPFQPLPHGEPQLSSWGLFFQGRPRLPIAVVSDFTTHVAMPTDSRSALAALQRSGNIPPILGRPNCAQDRARTAGDFRTACKRAGDPGTFVGAFARPLCGRDEEPPFGATRIRRIRDRDLQAGGFRRRACRYLSRSARLRPPRSRRGPRREHCWSMTATTAKRLRPATGVFVHWAGPTFHPPVVALAGQMATDLNGHGMPGLRARQISIENGRHEAHVRTAFFGDPDVMAVDQHAAVFLKRLQ